MPLNPIECAFAGRSVELTIEPMKTSFDYLLKFESTSPKLLYFSATRGDLEQFKEQIDAIVCQKKRKENP